MAFLSHALPCPPVTAALLRAVGTGKGLGKREEHRLLTFRVNMFKPLSLYNHPGRIFLSPGFQFLQPL